MKCYPSLFNLCHCYISSFLFQTAIDVYYKLSLSMCVKVMVNSSIQTLVILKHYYYCSKLLFLLFVYIRFRYRFNSKTILSWGLNIYFAINRIIWNVCILTTFLSYDYYIVIINYKVIDLRINIFRLYHSTSFIFHSNPISF